MAVFQSPEQPLEEGLMALLLNMIQGVSLDIVQTVGAAEKLTSNTEINYHISILGPRWLK